jgi:WD40 repeat protein
MAAPTRYAAFISYSSLDAAIARRLHRDLEAYRIPPSVGAFQLTDAPNSKNRLFPCFRDREELSSGHLGQAIENALRDCSALIVICSRNSAKSQWVDKEVRYFADTLGRRDRIFAIIVDGEPNARDAALECFPPALRRASIGDAEVVAGDARRSAEGYRAAFLKVVAGMIGVNLGRLTDRDAAARRLRAMTAGGAVAALLVGVLGTIGTVDRVQARTAFREAAARVAEDNPTESARFLLAATRAGSELIPSAAGAEALFASQVYGAVGIDALPKLGNWAASPDGARFATWGHVSPEADRAEAQLVDANTGAVVQQFEFHHAQFSPDSFSFVGWSSAETAALYNSGTGALIGDLGPAREVVFAQDGRTVLTLPGGALHDAHTGAVLARFGDGFLLSATVAREHIAIEDADRTWLVIDSRSGRRVTVLQGARQLVLAPVGARTLTADRDSPILNPFQPIEDFLFQQFPTITLRDGNGRAIAMLGEALRFSFSADGTRVAAQMGGGVKLWDAASGRLIADYPDFQQYALATEGSRMVAYGRRSGALVDTTNGQVVSDIAEMRPSDFLTTEWLNPTGAATFSPDGRYFTVTAGQGSGLYLSQSGERLGDAAGDVFSPDGRWLFGGPFYTLPSSELAFELPEPISFERVAMFSQDSTTLFTPAVLQVLAVRVNERLEGRPGAQRRSRACHANRDAIGAFDMLQRDPSYDEFSGAVGEHLIGRPWHACDWRGALSPAGWAQTIRYWAVKLGADWDYAKDECTRPRRGFGCPG